MKAKLGHEIHADHKFAVLFRRAPESEVPTFDCSFETRAQAHRYISKGGANGADGRFTVCLDHEFRGGTYRSAYGLRDSILAQ